MRTSEFPSPDLNLISIGSFYFLPGCSVSYAICTIGTEIFPETDTGLNRSSKTIIVDGFSNSLKPVAGTAVNPFFSILTEGSYEIGVSASCFGLAVNVGDSFVSRYPTDTFVIPVDHISGSV